MANTYTQLYIQLIFSVKFRDNLIKEPIREEIQKYISGIISNQGHKAIAIFCMPDHCHILVGLNPKQSLSDLVRDTKSSSSKWINERKLTKTHFQWQEGYGAFTYGKSQLPTIINYIANQKEHHRKRTFKEEYIDFLKKFEIEYNQEYLFDWLT
jgi:REP element-mobilizing transposase RayT